MGSRFTAAAVVLLLAAPVVGGCFSSATLTTASPLGEGRMEVLASPNFTGAIGAGPSPTPNVDLAVRIGATEWLDVGMTIHTFILYNLDLKLVLYQSDLIALAVDPTIGIALNGVGEARLPILFDVKAGEVLKFSVGAQYKVLLSGDSNDMLHVAGGMVAVEFRIDPSFYLMPHFSVLAGINKLNGNSPGVISTTGVAAKLRFGGH